MSLPNPGMDFDALDTLPAASLDDMVENIEALADGSGLDNDAVTDAKLVYGKLRSRQGGSATNWGTTGTTTYDYSGTNVFTQVGSKSTGGTQTTSVTFPTAFNQVPLVFCTPLGSGGVMVTWYIVSVGTTGFSFVTNSGTDLATFYWMAIGE